MCSLTNATADQVIYASRDEGLEAVSKLEFRRNGAEDQHMVSPLIRLEQPASAHAARKADAAMWTDPAPTDEPDDGPVPDLQSAQILKLVQQRGFKAKPGRSLFDGDS